MITKKKYKYIYSTFCLFSNTETIMNESGIDDAFEAIYMAVKRNIERLLGKRSVRLLTQF